HQHRAARCQLLLLLPPEFRGLPRQTHQARPPHRHLYYALRSIVGTPLRAHHFAKRRLRSNPQHHLGRYGLVCNFVFGAIPSRQVSALFRQQKLGIYRRIRAEILRLPHLRREQPVPGKLRFLRLGFRARRQFRRTRFHLLLLRRRLLQFLRRRLLQFDYPGWHRIRNRRFRRLTANSRTGKRPRRILLLARPPLDSYTPVRLGLVVRNCPFHHRRPRRMRLGHTPLRGHRPPHCSHAREGRSNQHPEPVPHRPPRRPGLDGGLLSESRGTARPAPRRPSRSVTTSAATAAARDASGRT